MRHKYTELINKIKKDVKAKKKKIFGPIEGVFFLRGERLHCKE